MDGGRHLGLCFGPHRFTRVGSSAILAVFIDGCPRERLHMLRVATGVSEVRFVESRVGTKNAHHVDP